MAYGPSAITSDQALPPEKRKREKGPDTNALPDLVEKPDSSFLFVIGPENNTSYISVL